MKRLLVSLALATALASAHADNVPEGAAPCPRNATARVAFVFEGAPQAAPAQLAAVQAVQDKLGARACIRTFDHLSTGVDPDANARFLLGSLGLERYTLVFLLTRRHDEAITKVARQFPETTYLQLDGKSQAANLIAYRLDTQQALRTLRGSGLSAVKWSDAPPSASAARRSRVWADWQPLYGALAECALAGHRPKGSSWKVGLGEDVITGDAGTLASPAWQRAKTRAVKTVDICPGHS